MIIKYVQNNGGKIKTRWVFGYRKNNEEDSSVILDTDDIGEALKLILKHDLMYISEGMDRYYQGRVEKSVKMLHSFLDETMSGTYDWVLEEVQIIR